MNVEEYADFPTLMNPDEFAQPQQRSHDERFREYVLKITDGILDGNFSREGNEETVKFIDKHQLVKLHSDDAIILYPPLDKDKFKDCLRRNTYRKDSLKKEDHDVYTNYYVNRITEIKTIFEALDTIYRENQKPFKIGFDCGFVVEDTNEMTYTRTAPDELSIGRTIPTIIKNPADLGTYKIYVYAALGRMTCASLNTSSRHYVGCHTIMFQTTRLGRTGARVLIPGYEFLKKNRYIIDYGDDYNLCMFYNMAN